MDMMQRYYELRAYHRRLIITMRHLDMHCPSIYDLGVYWLIREERLVPSNEEDA